MGRVVHAAAGFGCSEAAAERGFQGLLGSWHFARFGPLFFSLDVTLDLCHQLDHFDLDLFSLFFTIVSHSFDNSLCTVHDFLAHGCSIGAFGSGMAFFLFCGGLRAEIWLERPPHAMDNCKILEAVANKVHVWLARQLRKGLWCCKKHTHTHTHPAPCNSSPERPRSR